jgi:phosphoribosylformylglycinamidine synthase PurS subunit
MTRVVVDVMPKPEILDPQGKAVTGALGRLGFAGVTVRQGKRFELEVDGELTDERLAEVHRAAETLLANTVIETFDVRVEGDEGGPSTGSGGLDEPTPTPLGGTDTAGAGV